MHFNVECGKQLQALRPLNAETTDGKRVELVGNIGSPQDLPPLLSAGTEGIGLFRTEFLYMDRANMPSEEEQFIAYKQVLEGMAGLPVIIRSMDIGGDKELSYFKIPKEDNPFLGWRAIRICLEHNEILYPQLRAMLRTSAFGSLRIMFPMVISVEEVLQLKEHLAICKQELKDEGHEFDAGVQLGIMIETPAAVLIADKLISHVDFFSIGSNDLTQYTLAVDRGNSKIAQLYSPFHPAVLRLIAQTIQAAQDAGKWARMCGSMAGMLHATRLLLGLGLSEFSMSAAQLPKVKQIIRKSTYADCQNLAREALNCNSVKEVQQLLEADLASIHLLE